MAADLLRRVSLLVPTANTWTVVVPAIPAGRSLVVAKISVIGLSASGMVFGLNINAPDGVGTGRLAHNVRIAAGDTWTETGIVLVSGDTLQATTDLASNMSIHVFGTEVDNGTVV